MTCKKPCQAVSAKHLSVKCLSGSFLPVTDVNVTAVGNPSAPLPVNPQRGRSKQILGSSTTLNNNALASPLTRMAVLETGLARLRRCPGP